MATTTAAMIPSTRMRIPMETPTLSSLVLEHVQNASHDSRLSKDIRILVGGES